MVYDGLWLSSDGIIHVNNSDILLLLKIFYWALNLKHQIRDHLHSTIDSASSFASFYD